MELDGVQVQMPNVGQKSEKSSWLMMSYSKDEILCEFKKLFCLAGPLIIVNLLVYGLSMISLMFVGHLGKLALSAASMATSFAAVTGTSLMVGMGSALDTFCGQAFGAKQYHLLGIHMQRAMIVLLSSSIPLAVIWFNAGNLLVFLGQDPEISAEAGLYARFMIPSLFANALLQCHIRFLQSQNNVVPMILSTGITTLLHILVCWIMVFRSGLGSRGAALANAVSLWINVLLLAIYVRFSPSCKKTWTGFSKEAFRNVPTFLKLAVPSAVMVCLEIWSFEMMVLLSGLLPNPQLETSVLSISIPLAVIWFNAGNLLVFLGQDPEISAEAGLYARFMIPSLFANALLQCHIRFLQSQNNVVPMILSTGITTLLHILVCWIMVFRSGLGSRGAALANAVSLWINVLLLAIYVRFSPSCKKTWTGFSKEAFRNVPTFLKLAVPSAVMVCLEIWSFEMMVLLSGLLPNPQLETSVLSISLNTSSMIYMIPLGLSCATSVRVSNELGAGLAKAALLAIRVSMILVVSEGILGALILILVRKLWGYCYSNEKEVVSYIAQMTLLLAGSHVVDGVQSVLSGAVRGSGRQKIGAIVNLGAYYLIGIPLAIFSAFVFHMGGKGLWFGIIAALFAQALFLFILTLCTNWEKEANKANERVYNTLIRSEVS